MDNAAGVRLGRYLTLSLGKAVFALPISTVREILDDMEITRVPHSPDCMQGVVIVRGSAVPVVDLGCRFGLEPVTRTRNTRIVIVECARGGRLDLVGALADSVREVLEILPEAVAPPPAGGGDFLKGIARVGDRFLLLLDVDQVFSGDILDVLSEAAFGDRSGDGSVNPSGREDSLAQAD